MAKLAFDLYFFVQATLAKEGLGAFLLKMTGAILFNTLTSKLFGPKIPNAQSRLGGHAVMTRSAVEYRRVVYGEAAISGPIVYNNTSGATRQDLWYMIALCEGEIDSLVSVWVDTDEITAANITWTPGTGGAAGSGSGAVTVAKYIDNSTNALYLYYGLGHDDQVALSPMVSAFGEWTTNHRLRGIAYLAAKCVYDANTEKVWQSGPPNNLKAVVRGRKIYDPRLDDTRVIDDTTSPLTYGSGIHRITDETTWQWSDNPALCVADYLYSYMDVAADSIDWVSIANAADDCEVQVVYNTASPQPTEDRFTCNGVISLGDSHKDNINKLLSSMDGKLSYAGGTWKLRASVWEASSVSFTESDFAGDIQIRGSAPKSERSNKIRGVFVDPNNEYEVNEFPPIIDSTYLTRDNNKVITKDLELPMTNDITTAQRLAIRLLRQDNNQIVVKATLNARGAKCEVGDVVDLTISKYSWSAKTFRVLEWQRNDNGTYDVTLREDSAATYTDPAGSDYITGNAASVTIPSEVVPPPTSFSASSVPYAIRLNWTNPATQEFDYVDVYSSDTSAWSGATRIASVRTDTYTHNLGSGTTKYYWIRCRRNNGDTSTRVPDSDTSTVTSTSGSGTDSVNLAGATLSDQQVVSTAEVAYQLTSGGDEQSYEGDGGSYSTIGAWLINGTNSNFECRLSKTSGTDPTSGNLATWEGLGSTRGWVWTDSTQDDSAVSFTGTIEIRDIAQSPAPVLASANVSVTIDAQSPDVTLSGGDPLASPQGTAVYLFDSQASPNDAVAGYSFNADGTVDEIDTGITGAVRYTQRAAGVEWIGSLPSPNLYQIRFTEYSGDATTSGNIGTWQSLTTDREFRWTVTGTGTLDGTVKVEIADGSSPVNIVATGYYRGRAFVSL